jgi:hypothetical protein
MFLLEKLTQADLLEALMVARMIWLRRNSVVFGRGFTPPTQIVGAVKISMERFSEASAGVSAGANESFGNGSPLLAETSEW